MERHQYTASALTSTQHQHQQVHSINTIICFLGMGCRTYTASAPTRAQHQYQKWMFLKNSCAAFSTQHQHRQLHGTNTIPTKTQHQCQKGMLKTKIMGCPKYTTSLPTSTRHQCNQYGAPIPKEDVFGNHGLPSVHSISTNRNTGSASTSTQRQCQKGLLLKHHGLAPEHSSSTNH